MINRLFKYVKPCTALTILRNKTLRWSAPDLFNDPFEFKSPWEFAFEWDDLKGPVLDRLSTLLTQLDDPIFVSGNPMAWNWKEKRVEYKGKDPAVVRSHYESLALTWIEIGKIITDRAIWLQTKQQYRVLCFSSVHNDILMWSHYSEEHRGAVLEFVPIIELNTATLAARPVRYSKDVPTAGTLDEFVGFIVGQRLEPNHTELFEKSVYTKSSDWAYENEWRILSKKQNGESELTSDRVFHACELAAVYLGCRMSPEDRDRIIGVVSNWETPVSLFQMRDERFRFELITEPIAKT
jgi:hypothetical protein